jgi:hypothetical protein
VCAGTGRRRALESPGEHFVVAVLASGALIPGGSPLQPPLHLARRPLPIRPPARPLRPPTPQPLPPLTPFRPRTHLFLPNTRAHTCNSLNTTCTPALKPARAPPPLRRFLPRRAACSLGT